MGAECCAQLVEAQDSRHLFQPDAHKMASSPKQ